MFKDFLYLFFIVTVNNKKRYFLNYRKAQIARKKHCGERFVSFDGYHITKGLQNFYLALTFKPQPPFKEMKICKDYFQTDSQE